jgi:SNF2 family DNA or RNA helicase
LMERTGSVEVKEGRTLQAGAVINQITRLDPDTPQFHEMARVRRNLGMLKAPHCAKFIIDELEAEKDFAPENRTKTVVFAHHKDVIKIIHAEAEKRMKGAFLVYDGSVGSAKKKQDIVDQFQSDDNIRGLIISLAGNSGITLTQSARMRVVEPDWSPSNMIQIEDRIWRIGQEKNVDIGYMSVAGTLDARIGMAIADKMETDERSVNSITFRHNAPSQKVSMEIDESAGSRVQADIPTVLESEENQGEPQPALPLFE